MKRFLILLVVSCLMLNMAFSGVLAADAENVEISVSEIKTIISEFGEKLGNASAVDRNEGFLLGKTYLSTDDGIDTLIEIINNDEMAANPVVADIYKVLGDISQRKEQVVFFLEFLKCFDENDRVDVLERFRQRESIKFSASEKGKIQDVFNYFVSDDVIEALENDNSVSGEMIASLFTIFDGKMMLTDTSAGSSDFELKSISTSFKRNFSSMLEAYSVSGKSYNAESFIEMILDDVNKNIPKATKNKIKDVFATVGIYEAKKESKTDSSGNSNDGVTYKDNASGSETGANSSNIEHGTQSPGYIVSPAEIVAQYNASGNGIQNFDDVIGHWSANYVAVLRKRGILAGDGGTNNYRPDSKITREEMAVIVMRILNIRDGSDGYDGSDFDYNDANAVSDWAFDSVAFLTSKGILKGYPDGSFGPKKEITREEAVAIFARVLAYKYSPLSKFAGYVDWNNIGDWAKDDVAYSTRLGILTGYTTGEFLPKNTITRAEVATIIYRMMCVEGLIK